MCARIDNSNQPVHLHCLMFCHCPHKHFASLAIKNVPSEDSDQTVQADLNLDWVHMSEGIFSDILTYSHHTWNKMIAVFN